MFYIFTFFCIALYLFFIIFIISGLFKHKIIDLSSDVEAPTVSVVIAARNEEKNLPDLIHDLINQEYPLNKLEIIFIDDRSTDLTSTILSEASNNYSFIKYISISEKSLTMTSKKNALSKGIDIATGEIIVSTDADCRVGKLWASSMAYSVLNKNCISIGFSTINGDKFFDQYQKIDFLGIISANAGAGGWNQFWSGTGQNLAYYKKDFLDIDGFNPVKEKISGDDMYLVQSITKIKTGLINIDPNSFVRTDPMTTLKSFINQRIRWSSNAKINIKENRFFFIFLLNSLLFNFIILISFLFGNSWIPIFTLKIICDGLVIMLGAKLFDTHINLLSYFLWALLQPIYVPLIAFMGLREKFTWKE